MANMTFKASLIPNTNLGYSLGSSSKLWDIWGTISRYSSAATTTPLISQRSYNKDILLYQIGHATAADGDFSNSYRLLYKGTGSSPNNYLQLIANTSSTDTIAFQVDENGNITCTNTVNASISGSAASLTTSGTAAQFYRGDQTWSDEISGGLLKITNNSNTVTIGSANSWYCHFSNSADIPFYFNKNIYVDGHLYPYGTTNTKNLGYTSNRWKALYIGTADSYGSATKPIYWSGGVPTECTTYAGGTAVTLNGTSKAGSTASFYAPTASGTANTQALLSKGANTAPAWTNISPSITITAGTSSATPKVNVTVLGQSGTAQAITTASTSVYGCTKLTSSYTSSDSTLAATGASIAAAIGGLDVAAVGGGTGEYISKIQETDGKISATKSTTSVSNAWGAGVASPPTIRTIVNGVTGAAVNIPAAAASASGAVIAGEQTFGGIKHFTTSITVGARTAWNKGAAGVVALPEGEIHLGHASHGGHFAFHWQNSSATTAFISERQNGTIQLNYRLAVNANTHWQTLGGAATTTAFQFVVLGNGFIRDTIYTNAAVYVRKALTSATAYNTVLQISNNNVVYGQMQIYNGTAATAGQCILMVGNSTAAGTANNANGVYRAYNAAGGYNNIGSIRGALGGTTRDYVSLSYMKGTQIWGAVWNDYAEFRKTKEQIEPGRCVIETGKGDMILSTKRLQNGAEIISDTFGFAIGQNEHNNTPIAVSGRVLAYLYEDKEYAWNYIGWPVCSGPNGTVSIMTEEEASKYPWKIIGTISEIPNYDKWQIGEKEDNNFVNVNNRIWIRIK